MSLEESILTFMRQRSYVPQNADELAETLQLDKKGKKRLYKTLSHLLKKGVIAQVKKGRYVIPKDADLVTGIIKFKPSGAALLIPESDSEKVFDPYHIRSEDTDTALHGDLVLARLIAPQSLRPIYRKGKRVDPFQDGDKKFVKVIRILNRANTTVTGTLQKDTHYYYVIPDDPRFHKDILVNAPSETNLDPAPEINDKVVVCNIQWNHRYLNPIGEIDDVLGVSHTPNAELEALLHKYKLSPEFPPAVEREVKKLPSRVSDKDMKNRLDYRNVFTITIDPEDSKDFDDALSIEKITGGLTRVGVHIADVSAYVRPNTNLDKEAQARGNSTYLVEMVIPMLPHKLSSGLCSLIENENRLTKSVFLDFDKKGILKATSFANTVINSNKRLTYKQAYNFLFEDDLKKVRKTPMPPAHQTGFTGKNLASLPERELRDIQHCVKALWEIAEKLRKKRMQKGSLDLEMPEVKIYIDLDGYPDRIERVHNDESHQLIEEFMLSANEAVAKKLHEAGMPYISRVHDKPNAEKLEELGETLATFGVSMGDLTHRPEVVKLLEILKTHPQGHSLKVQFLRSLKQACYRAEAQGHYGLYKTFYTHFTSPIRRYSDLIVHRVFDEYMLKYQIQTAHKKLKHNYTQVQQNKLAKHLSLTEQNSTEAERESTKIKLIEFFEIENKRKEKRPFSAMIIDIRNHGMFVELQDSMAFGLIHISSLQDDLYTLTNNGNMICGRRNKRQYAVGQLVQVVVERVDRFKRQIDFRLHEDYVRKSPWGKTRPPFPNKGKKTFPDLSKKKKSRRNPQQQ